MWRKRELTQRLHACAAFRTSAFLLLFLCEKRENTYGGSKKRVGWEEEGDALALNEPLEKSERINGVLPGTRHKGHIVRHTECVDEGEENDKYTKARAKLKPPHFHVHLLPLLLCVWLLAWKREEEKKKKKRGIWRSAYTYRCGIRSRGLFLWFSSLCLPDSGGGQSWGLPAACRRPLPRFPPSVSQNNRLVHVVVAE